MDDQENDAIGQMKIRPRVMFHLIFIKYDIINI
jgi:hypothetical protein